MTYFLINHSLSGSIFAFTGPNLLNEVNPSYEGALIQESALAPYPGNTLTQIFFQREPPRGLASKLVELDPNGDIIWSYAYTPKGKTGTIYDAEMLSNGNILFAGNVIEDLPQFPEQNLHSQIIEMTKEGEVVWQHDLYWRFFIDHEIHDVDKLENGNVLIADTARDRVIEVTMDHQIVWEWKAIDWFDPPSNWDPLFPNSKPSEVDPDQPYNDWTHLNDVDRLSNGNTLISLRNLCKVIEVDKKGSIVWEWGGKKNLGYPHNPDKLRNGNVLICDSGWNRIIEVNTTTKEIVWQYEGMLSWPRDADRLPNGNTLIADSLNNRVIEITLDGRIVWERTGLTRVYEADRLKAKTPLTVSIEFPRNQTYSTTTSIPVILSDSDWNMSTFWFRIQDNTRNRWLDPGNVTWHRVVERVLPPGHYTIYAYARESTDWWQGADVHFLPMSSMTNHSFTVMESNVAINQIWVNDESDPFTQIEKGQEVVIYVNVTNQGDLEERVQVNLKYIANEAHWTELDSQKVTFAPKTAQVLTFHWNTSELALTEYKFVAEITTSVDDSDIIDNSGTVVVVIIPALKEGNFTSVAKTSSIPPLVRELPRITFERNYTSLCIILFLTALEILMCVRKKRMKDVVA